MSTVLDRVIEALFAEQGVLLRELDWEKLDKLSDAALVRELERLLAERKAPQKGQS